MLLCLQGYDYTICYCPSKEMALSDTFSQFSPCPGPDILLDIAIHHAHLSPERKEAFQQAFVSNPEICPLTDMIITGWPDDIKAVPCPLCPYWQHWPSPLKMALSYVEKPSSSLHQKGRGYYNNSTSSIKESPKPSCSHAWMCLLAGHKQSHKRSSSAVWDLHLVPSPKCCSTPHSYTKSILPMADVCHGHLYLGRNQLPDMWWLLFKYDPHLTSSIQPEQHWQSCLTAQRNVLRAWNSQSTLLWQQPSVCECIGHWVLHLLGYHTQDLKPSLPAIEWVHAEPVCKIHEACTPMH